MGGGGLTLLNRSGSKRSLACYRLVKYHTPSLSPERKDTTAISSPPFYGCSKNGFAHHGVTDRLIGIHSCSVSIQKRTFKIFRHEHACQSHSASMAERHDVVFIIIDIVSLSKSNENRQHKKRAIHSESKKMKIAMSYSNGILLPI